jgi:hypothetical protein
MNTSRIALSTVLLIGALIVSSTARAGSCINGGELNIIASGDSLTLAPTPATTFNFGEHVIVTAQATGFSITSYTWTIGGPTVKDYNDDLGTKESPPPTAAWPWSTTPLQATDLTAPSVAFYWVPLSSQFEPNNGPFTRNVILRVNKSTGGSCQVTATFTVERNQTDINRQAEDFYTSNHRAPTTTNPAFGHVIDEHIYWHQNVHGLTSYPIWTRFLTWHGEFIRRFDLWRQLFGYRKVDPWYPGTPLPTGPAFDVDPSLRLPYVPDDNRIPTYFTIAGGTDADSTGKKKLADYPTLDTLNYAFEGFYHSQVHCAIGTHLGNTFASSGTGYGSMCKNSSPKDPMFWRWHGFIDIMYRNYCALKPAGACPVPSPPDPSAEPFMADNSADNGVEPSTPPYNVSQDVWNRTEQNTTDACVGPVDAYGNRITAGGVIRRCGTNLDHQAPIAGQTNYLYGRLRNTRTGSPKVMYSEVAVYYALTSSALIFPNDYTLIPESRQFIALHTNPGSVTSIGPVPWVPPVPANPNDQYALYLRILSTQAAPPTIGGSTEGDVATNRDVVRRDVVIMPPPAPPPEEPPPSP